MACAPKTFEETAVTDVEVNRMADPIRPDSPDEVNLLDVETQECPYPAYKVLRDEAPIWKDPVTGFYTVTTGFIAP